MDQIVATCSYLKGVIGLGANQEGTNFANVIIAEGLGNPANLVKLEEYEGVKTLCQDVRNPEGMEPQPVWNAPNPNPWILTSPRVARLGKYIPAISYKMLNIAVYGDNILRLLEDK